eukprot:GEMP01035485.1.p1 GENE.GEMP01035485.1~~GEMP01035485.1.p1  ORF type:complete len:513 (+),score=112.17 GEMP01035485.1:193-1731(+)
MHAIDFLCARAAGSFGVYGYDALVGKLVTKSPYRILELAPTDDPFCKLIVKHLLGCDDGSMSVLVMLKGAMSVVERAGLRWAQTQQALHALVDWWEAAHLQCALTMAADTACAVDLIQTCLNAQFPFSIGHALAENLWRVVQRNEQRWGIVKSASKSSVVIPCDSYQDPPPSHRLVEGVIFRAVKARGCNIKKSGPLRVCRVVASEDALRIADWSAAHATSRVLLESMALQFREAKTNVVIFGERALPDHVLQMFQASDIFVLLQAEIEDDPFFQMLIPIGLSSPSSLIAKESADAQCLEELSPCWWALTVKGAVYSLALGAPTRAVGEEYLRALTRVRKPLAQFLRQHAQNTSTFNTPHTSKKDSSASEPPILIEGGCKFEEAMLRVLRQSLAQPNSIAEQNGLKILERAYLQLLQGFLHPDERVEAKKRVPSVVQVYNQEDHGLTRRRTSAVSVYPLFPHAYALLGGTLHRIKAGDYRPVDLLSAKREAVMHTVALLSTLCRIERIARVN